MKTAYYLLIVCVMIGLSIPATAQEASQVWTDFLPSAKLPKIYKNAAKDRLRVDFDGDGKPEIATTKENDDGETTAIYIWNPRLQAPSYVLEYGTPGHVYDPQGFHVEGRKGIAAVLNGGTEDAVMLVLQRAFNDAQILTDSMFVYSFDSETVIASFPSREGLGKARLSDIQTLTTFTLLDMNGDSEPEIVVQDESNAVLEVWTVAENTSVSIESAENGTVELLQAAYPNPGLGMVTIPYSVDSPGTVTLRLLDLLGREVRTLVKAEQPAGTYQIEWDGSDDVGEPVAAGTYFYQLQIESRAQTRSLVRLR